MSNEEFQRLVLEKLGKLDARLDKLEKRMDEIQNGVQVKNNIRTSFDDVSSKMETQEELERLENFVNKLAAIQVTQGESISILALRQLQTESEVAVLKKAK